MAFLQLTGISKGYGIPPARREVLRDVNLSLDRGEFVAIVGYSGAGKTTLINLIAGLIPPDSGHITLNDLDIAAPGPDRGLVFQNYSLLPWLTVFENIRLAVDPVFPNWSEAKKRRHILDHLRLVQLESARDKKPAELSGGMRQRVSVARALAMEPQVLLLDEPLGALDALTRASLQDEIARIWQENRQTVVLITNDPFEGLYLADRIIPLSAGPSATLGPAMTVNLPRPRDRRHLSHDPQFKAIRDAIFHFLERSRASAPSQSEPAGICPDLQPEDLDRPRGPRPSLSRPPKLACAAANDQ